jgi:hypothetical protein
LSPALREGGLAPPAVYLVLRVPMTCGREASRQREPPKVSGMYSDVADGSDAFTDLGFALALGRQPFSMRV